MTDQNHAQFSGPMQAAFNVGRWILAPFGGGQDEPAVVNDKKVSEILAFLKMVDLEPTPEAYKFVWEYKYGANLQLRLAVDRLLEKHERVTATSIRQLSEIYLDALNPAEISDLVSSGKRALRSGHKIIADNRSANCDYSSALEQQVEKIDSAQADDSQFRTLLNLTNSIIEKSQHAEEQLKSAETQIAEMRKKLNAATQKAETDQLTGLPNRWAFEDHLEDALLRAREACEPLTVAFIDIDHFKRINDTHGHEAGDRVLKLVAEYLDGMSDNKCHLARHGGEEFVVLFANQTPQQVYEIVDAVRSDIAGQKFVNRETDTAIGTVSFSAGIASLGSDSNSRAMLRRADAALYHAKENGRNRVVINVTECSQ